MIFNSLIFIFIFLPISVLLYFISPNKVKNLILLCISLIFYSLGEPVYIILLIINIIINYLVGILIKKTAEDKERSKFIFVCGVVLNLLVLIFFKYYGFFIDNINTVFHSSLRIKELALPLGLSFYTFKGISYIADVYRGKNEPTKNFIKIALYISMFMQITAGPIEQYNVIESKLENRKIDLRHIGGGVERFIIGLFKKVLLADNISVIFTTVQGFNNDKLSVITVWLGIIAYAFQIYFDFSGYSDMAIGLGMIFGFDFKENFNYPYISKSIGEFWRRWHISLSTWFRDYIYIPLGGNRTGMVKQVRNLFIVWFVTGFWHGASWVFILWGLYFGVILFCEKFLFGKYIERLPNLLRHIYALIMILVGWTIFSSSSIQGAIHYLAIMFGLAGHSFLNSNVFYLIGTNVFTIVLCVLASTPIFKRMKDELKHSLRGTIILIVAELFMFVVSVIYITGQGYNSFLYTKF